MSLLSVPEDQAGKMSDCRRFMLAGKGLMLTASGDAEFMNIEGPGKMRFLWKWRLGKPGDGLGGGSHFVNCVLMSDRHVVYNEQTADVTKTRQPYISGVGNTREHSRSTKLG